MATPRPDSNLPSRGSWSARIGIGWRIATAVVVTTTLVAARPARAEESPDGNLPQAAITGRVRLPNQDRNVFQTAWPGLFAYFFHKEHFETDVWRQELEAIARHAGAGLLTHSYRHGVEVTDPKVHDLFKATTAHARSLGLGIVLDLDSRFARRTFRERHPDEMQELIRVRDVSLDGVDGVATVRVPPLDLTDHYTGLREGYDTYGGRVARVYSFVEGAEGIDPGSVRDITDRATSEFGTDRSLTVRIPVTAADKGRTAAVLAAFTLLSIDVFAPHLIPFERQILEQYADLPLAGACKDEWGFPGRDTDVLRTDDLWFSPHMAAAYAARRPGHDLLRDTLLMAKGERGREGDRMAAIDHFMEMGRQRCAEVENAFDRNVKAVFGPQAMMATHPTWWPGSDRNEAFKNGLSWWAVRRELAQTDESTPFAVRTALCKKWHSPLWYNMWYASGGAVRDNPKVYAQEVWRSALMGGRVNFHPYWPEPAASMTRGVVADPAMAADCRVRLLNAISTAPLDCPVAVVFGHPYAVNWAGGRPTIGRGVAADLRAAGYYADIIPSSEIADGSLTLGEDGSLRYGPQRYAAAVFMNLQFERPAVADFVRRVAAGGKTAVFRGGAAWTMDFDGRPLDGDEALAGVPVFKDAAAVVAHMKEAGVEPQTPNADGEKARRSGRNRLLDGTVFVIAADDDVMGDPIRQSFTVGGEEVRFDAVGVAAARMDKDGRLAAMAAGGLKSFAGGGVTLELPAPADVAIWRDDQGRWRGLVQGWSGPLPAALTALTKDWIRLAMPERIAAR